MKVYSSILIIKEDSRQKDHASIDFDTLAVTGNASVAQACNIYSSEKFRKSPAFIVKWREFTTLCLQFAAIIFMLLASGQEALSQSVSIEYMAHVQRDGDTEWFKEYNMVGTEGIGRRLEGFSIRLVNNSPPIEIQYMAHIQGDGDTDWINMPGYVGTRGEGKRLEGFAIKIIDQPDRYSITYRAHLQGDGWTPWHRNGSFCGTRDEKRRVEAIEIAIVPATPLAQSTEFRCVQDLIIQCSGDEKLDIGQSDGHFGIPKPPLGGHVKYHIQGVARLDDWNGLGRMAITYNRRVGLTLAFQNTEGANEAVFSQNERLHGRISFDIRNVRKYGNHDHPGGIQATGNVLAIAMEKGRADHAGVYFLQVDGNQISYLRTLYLDGSRGEPFQRNDNSAEAVGIVKQLSGRYLLAVSNDKGIWFYESIETTISATTQWVFVNFFTPDCRGIGSPEDECYSNVSGLSLVLDCSDKIYLLGMNGTKGPGRDHQDLQIFEIRRQQNGHFTLDKQLQQRGRVGRHATREFSFRWGGGTYVTRNGQLVVMNTERRFRKNSNDYVNGSMFFGKPIPHSN